MLTVVTVLTVVLGGCVRMGFHPHDPQGAEGDAGTAGMSDGGGADGAWQANTRGGSGQPGPGPGSDASGPVQLILGIQGKQGSFLRRLTYDPTLPAGQQVSLAQTTHLETMTGSQVRGLSLIGAGRLLAGNGFTLSAEVVGFAPLKSEGALVFAGGASAPTLGNIHGACRLPSGHLIAGEFSTKAGNTVEELALSDGRYVRVRKVYETIITGGALSHCAAPSDSEVYLTDYDGLADKDGDVVRLTLQGGAWKLERRFDASAFAAAKYGPEYGGAIYSFVAHRAGALYLLPLRRHGKRLRRLIRCQTPDISAAGCVELGLLPPDSGVGAKDAIQGAAQLPDSEDLIFASNSKLYRYELEAGGGAGSWEELYDLRSSTADLTGPSGAVDVLAQVRNLLVTR